MVRVERGNQRVTDGWIDCLTEWPEGRWGPRGETKNTGCHSHSSLSFLYFRYERLGLFESEVIQRRTA